MRRRWAASRRALDQGVRRRGAVLADDDARDRGIVRVGRLQRAVACLRVNTRAARRRSPASGARGRGRGGPRLRVGARRGPDALPDQSRDREGDEADPVHAPPRTTSGSAAAPSGSPTTRARRSSASRRRPTRSSPAFPSATARPTWCSTARRLGDQPPRPHALPARPQSEHGRRVTTVPGDAPERMVLARRQALAHRPRHRLLRLSPSTGALESTIEIGASGIDLAVLGDDSGFPSAAPRSTRRAFRRWRR